ncbi:endonuclease/exonuclease/phosphatase family protein [Streptomyces sp. NPDC060205]|uniref:endonuclease/exonuclease/phosphatase family protein n=1 Tax=Streptomyces sp. NPDC060205 TaxID=3347072 RepID=UPI00364B2F58
MTQTCGPCRSLLASGWQDPETITQVRRAPTVGYYYAGEQGDVCLDHILVRGLTVRSYQTYDTQMARRVSDHLPTVLDAEIDAPAQREFNHG